MKKRSKWGAFLFSTFVIFFIYPTLIMAQEKEVLVNYSVAANSLENVEYPTNYEHKSALAIAAPKNAKELPRTNEKTNFLFLAGGIIVFGVGLLISRNFIKKVGGKTDT